MHVRHIGSGELIPALAAKAFGRDAMLFEQVEGERIDRARRMTARTERTEFAAADRRMIHHCLGEDRARGISRAQEQHVQHVYRVRGNRSGLSVNTASTPRSNR